MSTAGSTKATDWNSSPRLLWAFDVSTSRAAITPTNSTMTMRSWMNFSGVVMGGSSSVALSQSRNG